MRDGCPFCDYEGPSEIRERFERVFVIEPLNPVTPGHLLVIPEKHVVGFEDAAVVRDVADVLALVIGRRSDLNVIASVGAAATQTVPHLHVHVVPRRESDGLLLPWSGYVEREIVPGRPFAERL